VDVVGEEARPTGQHVGQGEVDGVVERVDRAVASAEASHWLSPEMSTTAPRLWTLLPEATVQRARVSAGASPVGAPASGAVVGLIDSPPGAAGRSRFACRREVPLVAAAQLGAALPDHVLE